MIDLIFSNDIENEYNAIETKTSNLLSNIKVYGFNYEFNEEQCGFDFKKYCTDPPTVRLGLLVTDDKIKNIIDRYNIKLYYGTLIKTTINKPLYIPFEYSTVSWYTHTYFNFNFTTTYHEFTNVSIFVYIIAKSKTDKAKIKLIL